MRSGQLAVGIRPLDCNNYENIVSDFIISENTLTVGEMGGDGGRWGGGGRGGYGGKTG